jgi:hypothetical protein
LGRTRTVYDNFLTDLRFHLAAEGNTIFSAATGSIKSDASASPVICTIVGAVTSTATIGASPPVTVKLNCAASFVSFKIIGCDGSCDNNPKPTIFAGVVVKVAAVNVTGPIGLLLVCLKKTDRK